MARPGGNPDLVKYQFRLKEDAPLEKKLSINLTKEMHREVMKRGGSEFIREAIKKARRSCSLTFSSVLVSNSTNCASSSLPDNWFTERAVASSSADA